MSAVQLPKFGYTPKRFTLHSVRPDSYTIRWAGVQWTMPPGDTVSENSAKDADGDPIPGTYVLEDSWSAGPDGTFPDRESPPNWSAFMAIKNILAVDSAGNIGGVHAQAGISYLPENPSKEMVEAIVSDGKKRYEDGLVIWADHVVQGYAELVNKCRQANTAAPPPGEDYKKALHILRKHERKVEEAVSVAGPEDDSEMEFMVFAKAKAMELAAKQTRPGIDKEKLAEELVNDQDFLNMLRKKGLRIRKKGYAEPPEPQEDPATE